MHHTQRTIDLSHIDAVLFDMDGLLLDSEPVWRRVEGDVFRAHGLDLTPKDFARTMGMRIDEVVAHHASRLDPPGDAADLTTTIIDRMADALRTDARDLLLPGALDAVRAARTSGRSLGLASSSPRRIIHAVLDALDLHDAFDVVASAEKEPYGKPHPAVFLTAATALGTPAEECLVLEDSFHGLIAAKAACMRCVVVPAPADRDDPRWVVADAVWPDLRAADQVF